LDQPIQFEHHQRANRPMSVSATILPAETRIAAGSVFLAAEIV
jgi:hypothetical protein